MKNSSHRTTALGIIAILVAVLSGARAVLEGAVPDYGALVAAISAGLGLLFAKDARVTGLPGDEAKS
jgi:hypothetical protein